jgi:hypothetical protein
MSTHHSNNNTHKRIADEARAGELREVYRKKEVTTMIGLFPLGQVVATPDALAALERANQCPAFFLARHATGDWGELNASDIAENEYKHGEWISAAEQLPDTHWGKALGHHRGRPVGNCSTA